MEIKVLTYGDPLWESTANFAENCIWPAGKALAQHMRDGDFRDWERVFVALDGETIAGFCTLTQTDLYPKAPYCPYIGFLFVDLPFRGNRLSSDLIDAAAAHAKASGFDRVFLTSDHVGLYEKYGFAVVDQRPAPWNKLKTEKIYMREMDPAPAPKQRVDLKNMARLLLYLLLVIGLWYAVGKLAFPG